MIYKVKHTSTLEPCSSTVHPRKMKTHFKGDTGAFPTLLATATHQKQLRLPSAGE